MAATNIGINWRSLIAFAACELNVKRGRTIACDNCFGSIIQAHNIGLKILNLAHFHRWAIHPMPAVRQSLIRMRPSGVAFQTDEESDPASLVVPSSSCALPLSLRRACPP